MYINYVLKKKKSCVQCILEMLLPGVALFVLSSCDPVTIALGSAAIAGTETTRNHKGIIGTISDSDLQVRINAALLKQDPDLFDKVELSVKHGTVIVIGCMNDKEQCRRAIQIAVEVCGTRATVYDETSVSSPTNAKNFAVDSSITSRIKSSLAFDGNVRSRNYDVTTVKGIVYICGTAESKYERDIVLNCARTTSGVDKVVSYIAINRKTK